MNHLLHLAELNLTDQTFWHPYAENNDFDHFNLYFSYRIWEAIPIHQITYGDHQIAFQELSGEAYRDFHFCPYHSKQITELSRKMYLDHHNRKQQELPLT